MNYVGTPHPSDPSTHFPHHLLREVLDVPKYAKDAEAEAVPSSSLVEVEIEVEVEVKVGFEVGFGVEVEVGVEVGV